MKDVLVRVGRGLLSAVDWRAVGYKAYSETIKPELDKLVKSTESKWDDAALQGVDYLVDRFLKPEETK